MFNTRRDFLRSSAAVGLATLSSTFAVPAISTSRALAAMQGANDQLRMGCIGVGSMGKGDAGDFSNLVDVVAIADVDSEYGLAQTLANDGIGTKRDGKKVGQPDAYKDYRKILERKDIDVVSVVTTDPWHVKIAIEALQAGKHVFCQKPLTLTIEESQLIRRACKKYGNLVFQVGTQQRSQRDQFALACLMVRKGLLGDIKKMTVDIGPSPTSEALPVEPVPASLDFEMWLGQCPLVDYRARRVHYEFRWWYEYSGGKFTDWGAHHIDFAHWALGYTKEGMGPTKITPLEVHHPVEFKDGYPTVDDRYNTSDKFEILCKFGDTDVHVCSESADGNGILIEGTKGRMHVDRGRIKGKPIEEKWYEGVITEDDFKALYNGKDFDGWHKRNFLTCIREGGLPVSDVFSHVQAMNTCHLCAISARLNRELNWDPQKEEMVGDDQAQSFVSRERRKGYDIPNV